MLQRGRKTLVYVLTVLAFWAIAAPHAHAYIDPGSSSYIVQILIGAGAGALLAIATFWRRIRVFFSKLFGRKTPEAPSSDAPSPE